MTVALAYDLRGPKDGPLVVLLHSIGTDRELWRDHVGPLVAAGRRVALVDLRGHGASPAPEGPYRLEDLGRDVLDLLERLGAATADVAGVSLGGAVALWLAAHAPDRVDRLVVCCSGATFGDPGLWSARAAEARRDGLGGMVDAITDRWFTPEVRRDCPERVAAVRATLLACPPEGYAACCEALSATDLTPVLGRIVAPTLVVAGAHDAVTPTDPSARALVEGIPGAVLSVVRTSHLAPYERPDLVAPLIVRHLGTTLGDADDEQQGLRTRREVLGEAHVQRAIEGATSFTAPFQRFITQYAWGDVWSRPGLDRRTRSIITLTALVALKAENEIPMHVRAALHHGLTANEIGEVLLHTSIYAGLPAANAAFAIAQQTLREEGALPPE